MWNSCGLCCFTAVSSCLTFNVHLKSIRAEAVRKRGCWRQQCNRKWAFLLSCESAWLGGSWPTCSLRSDGKPCLNSHRNSSRCCRWTEPNQQIFASQETCFHQRRRHSCHSVVGLSDVRADRASDFSFQRTITKLLSSDFSFFYFCAKAYIFCFRFARNEFSLA